MEMSLSIPSDDPRAVAVVKAIHEGDVAGLRKLLNDNPGLAQGRIMDEHGVARTLLHIAADWPGHFPNGAQSVAILVAAGADINAVVTSRKANGSAETPLHWAASSDDVAVLDALLDGGADIEAPGAVFTGGTAMSDAVVFAQWNAARRLLERGAQTTFWQAAALGQLDVVRGFVSARQSARDITNALWNACRGGQLAVARYLVEQGADINWVGHDEKTPIDMARESGVLELVQWLEGRGDPSARMPPC
jgi:ankyrin repeat protein